MQTPLLPGEFSAPRPCPLHLPPVGRTELEEQGGRPGPRLRSEKTRTVFLASPITHYVS